MPIKNIKEIKNQIRNKYKKLRANMTAEQKSALDEILTEKFVSNLEFKNSDVLFAFISKDIEVETKDIINFAFSHGKKVAVPKCRKDSFEMDFYYIKSFDDLMVGAYNILEPNIEKCQMVTDFSKGVCIVPGLSFDREGYRIGFGKGYYDRFLVNFKGTAIGLCYSRCIENKLPHGYYDKPIDIVITEKYIVDTRS